MIVLQRWEIFQKRLRRNPGTRARTGSSLLQLSPQSHDRRLAACSIAPDPSRAGNTRLVSFCTTAQGAEDLAVVAAALVAIRVRLASRLMARKFSMIRFEDSGVPCISMWNCAA